MVRGENCNGFRTGSLAPKEKPHSQQNDFILHSGCAWGWVHPYSVRTASLMMHSFFITPSPPNCSAGAELELWSCSETEQCCGFAGPWHLQTVHSHNLPPLCAPEVEYSVKNQLGDPAGCGGHRASRDSLQELSDMAASALLIARACPELGSSSALRCPPAPLVFNGGSQGN